MSLRKSKSTKFESKGRSQSVISQGGLWKSPFGAPPLPLDSPPISSKKKVRKDKLADGAAQKTIQQLEENLEFAPNNKKTKDTLQKVQSACESVIKKLETEIPVIKIQSLVRGWLFRRKYNQIVKDTTFSIRNEAFNEILKTERVYMRNLELLVEGYLYRIRDLLAVKSVNITHGDVAAIFSNVETIFEIHKDLCSKFEELNKRWPIVDTVGELFIKMADSLEPYGEYVKNFKYALDTLHRCVEHDEKFAHFLTATAEKTPDSGLDLLTLLTCPLNRITQYKIQLEVFVKNSIESNVDNQNLVNAYSMLSQLYDFIQENIEQADNLAAIRSVQRRVDVTEQEVLDIFSGKRQFIEEGGVTLLEAKNKKKRYVFLFNDLLLITKQNGKTNFHHKQIITIDGDTILQNISDSNVIKYAFKIVTIGKLDTVCIWKNQEEKDHWYKQIQTLIEASASKNKVFGVPLLQLIKTESAPEGIPFIMTSIVEYLLKTGLDIPGLFSTSIAANRTKSLKRLFEEGNVDLTKLELQEVATTFKIFLRSLPEPLLTFDLLSSFVSLVDEDNNHHHHHQLLTKMALLLKDIPQENRNVFGYLFSFLQKVCNRSSFNEMNSTTLSIIFGPCLLRSKQENMEYTLQIPKINRIVQIMLENFDEISKMMEGPREVLETKLFEKERTSSSKTLESVDQVSKLKMVALYNFTKRKETELTIQKGDIITVIQQHKSGWWKGELKGNYGKFPSNYCRMVKEEEEEEQGPEVESKERNLKVQDEEEVEEEEGEREEEEVSHDEVANIETVDDKTIHVKDENLIVEEKPSIVKAVALFNFQKRKEHELSFKKGDTLVVLERHKSGWWKGELNGQVGKFPSNYCKIQEEEQEEQEEVEKEDRVIQINGDIGSKSKEQKDVGLQGDTKVVEKPSIETIKSLDKQLPSSTSTSTSTSTMEIKSSMDSSSDLKSTIIDKKRVQAIFSFKRRKDTELSFNKGDIITVLEVHTSGWWKGELNGETGKFPGNYTKPLENNQEEQSSTISSSSSSSIISSSIIGSPIEKKQEEPLKSNESSIILLEEKLNNNNIIELPPIEEESKSIEQKKTLMRAQFNFTARNEKELSFVKGDVLTVIWKDSKQQGWWKGELNGKQGKFPSNYCKIIEE